MRFPRIRCTSHGAVRREERSTPHAGMRSFHGKGRLFVGGGRMKSGKKMVLREEHTEKAQFREAMIASLNFEGRQHQDARG